VAVNSAAADGLVRESRSAAGHPGPEVRNCTGQRTLMRHEQPRAAAVTALAPVENIEVMDFEVIVHLTGQLHRQVRDMPPGVRITGFTIAPPE
jgi:hypothetical protein